MSQRYSFKDYFLNYSFPVFQVFFVLLFASFTSCKKLSNSSNKNEPSAGLTENTSANAAGEKPSGVSIFDKKSKLPKCNDDLKDQMVFVKDESTFYRCADSKWAEVELKVPESDAPAKEATLAEFWKTAWNSNIQSVVYIETEYTSSSCTRYEAGSGFVVGANMIATNGHVIKAAVTDGVCGSMALAASRIWFADKTADTKHSERSDDATITAVDRQMEKTRDIVLAQVSTTGRSPIALSARNESQVFDKDSVSVGEEILLLGFSGATTFAHFSLGKINAIQKSQSGSGFLSALVSQELIAGGTMVLEYDLVSGAGSSGGPVLDHKGQVIAVNFAGNTKDADTEFGYAIPVRDLRELVAKTRQWTAIAPQ